MFEPVLFYTFSALAILSALLVVFLPRPTRSLLALIITMISLAVLFMLLGAYFIAMIHLIVYAGAVLVLFLFVIMLQGIGARDIPLRQRFGRLHFIFGGVVFVACASLLVVIMGQPGLEAQGIQSTVNEVGMVLYTKYLLPFELASILLLLGVFAAIALAKKEDS